MRRILSLALITSLTSLTSLFAVCMMSNQAIAYTGLGKESIDPATLEEYAPPNLDPQATRQIESILDVRSPGLGLLSPDGKTMFFSWSITGTRQVWRIDGPQSFPVQMTGGQDATSLMAISPDGKYLVLSRDRQGQENPGLYLQATDGSPLQVIQHDEGIRTSFAFIADDSRSIYYMANDISPESFAIYRYDLASKQKELLLSEPGVWYIADVLPGGGTGSKTFLVAKATGSLSREYYRFDEANKELTPWLGQDQPEEYVAQFGAHDGELLVLTPKLDQFRRLYRYTKGEFTPITPELPMDISGFEIDYQRQRILYSVNDRGYLKLKALDAKTFEPIELPEFADAELIYAGSFSRNGRYTSLGVSTATAPRTSYVYDWQTQKLTQWVLPSVPELDQSKFVGAKLESYPASDGTEIPMFVWRSPQCENATKPCPVVIHFHGGPESQSIAGFNRLAQLFVQAGFIYIEPNVRGSDGYGKAWLNADNGAKRLEVITDIADAAAYVRSAWQVNGTAPKVGIMGWSYGGYATLMGMTKFSGSYDAGVALVGMSNLLTFLENTAEFRRPLRISEYGDPERDRQALIELSPVTYLDQIQDPLLIIQGANDPRVPVGEALQIQQALEAKEIPSQLIIFPDEGHGSAKRSNQVLEIGHTINFFVEHLKP
jgi:dipeptidyl aminopeptidase/acylaminoacyl peptidase